MPLRSFITLFVALGTTAFAQDDAGYTAKIREFTTEPFFLTELVDHLPASPTVPSPQKVLGRIVGAPNVLSYVDDINGYMRALDSATGRVQVSSIGKSEEGREMIAVAVSDEANLKRLDYYTGINRKLGDPRKITPQQAEQLLKEGLPVYYLTGGMHCTESGPPEMLMELAYRLAVEETPFIQEIRKNAIVIITPVLDPDGRDRYVDTYMYRKANPTKPPIPLVYWGKYVAHDSNRDGMAQSLNLSKNLTRSWLNFAPIVFHDLHESVPFLYISTGTGPYNAWLDPITIDEWHILAYNEINEFTRRGVPGVWTHDFYDGWAANYGMWTAQGRNAIGRFYETYGGSGADTSLRNIGSQSQRDWFRPNPPYSQVRWSIRNNVNLSQSGVLFALHEIATEKEKFLRNYYTKSVRSIAKARTEGPAAWVLPSDEKRTGNQKMLVDMLLRQYIEVNQLDAELATADGTFPAGSIVVRMDQPYSRMADTMLDKQYYSPTDPTPYDDTGWTLGPLFNVKTVRVKDVKILDAAMHVYKPAAAAEVSSGSGFLVVAPAGDVLTQKLLQAFPASSITQKTVKAEGKDFPPGSLVVELKDSGSTQTAANLLAGKQSGFGFTSVRPEGTRPLKMPRIALVHTWTSTQDEGWFRLAFDEMKVPYSYVSVHELRDVSDLKSKYDVIVLPQTRGTAQSLVNGINKEGEPLPWKPIPGFKHLGGPDTSDNIRGGIELQGVLNLQRFLNHGGLLICVGNTCRIPIDYGLIGGVTVQEPKEIIAPGSVYRTRNESKDNPILAGFDDEVAVYFNVNTCPILSVGGGGFAGGAGTPTRASGRGDLTDPDVIQGRPPYNPKRAEGDAPDVVPPAQAARPRVLLRFAEADKLLISGALQNGQELQGKAALVQHPVGRGNVLLFSMNPMWRHQTQGSWQLLFNAAMNWENLALTVPRQESR